MKDHLGHLNELQKRIHDAMRIIDVEKKTAAMHALEIEMQDPKFWDDAKHAQEVSQQHGDLRSEIEQWQQIDKDVTGLIEFIEEVTEEDAHTVRDDVAAQMKTITRRFEKLEFTVLMSGEYDERPVIMAIHAGAGGTEAQDWTEMLLRMFDRFAQKREWKVEIVDESRGHEAGIKSVVLRIVCKYAYGNLKSEHGVHRLVRISPFDAEKMRHTSFALVEVLPELEDTKEIEIDAKDLRIDTFNSSGAGGQSVNTAYSAVRIVHEPTGIMVSCQNERSQQQNKETAMKILRSRLHKLYEEEKRKEKQELRGAYTSAEWGNQVRSYVLHPYQLVKDHRTKFESPDTEAVLNGDLDNFVEAYLKWNAARVDGKK